MVENYLHAQRNRNVFHMYVYLLICHNNYNDLHLQFKGPSRGG